MAEIESEISDAQDQSVCCCYRIDSGRRRRMGSVDYQSACRPFDRSWDRTVQTNDERKGTACCGVCRLYLRIPLNDQQTESLLPSRRGQPLDGLRPASKMAVCGYCCSARPLMDANGQFRKDIRWKLFVLR